ncbi:MAG: 3-deoxy-manno-octulosonate cytidylyltransferase, partial [Kiritimatiellia bacterium]|nr:3-deoxy-manno-octulosonate cytidylyltransferase [Kiritimatiellia bacterium]
MGLEVAWTSPDHPSGTDRVAEAMQDREADGVINIQGDEPMIDPELVDRLAETLAGPADWDMVTAAAAMTDPERIADPSVVKVVRAADGAALYFSRAPIPFRRDEADAPPIYLRHIGIYGYRRDFLARLVSAPPCALERCEKLEQLRALDLGARICVLETTDPGPGVDTPADVARAEAALRSAGRVRGG